MDAPALQPIRCSIGVAVPPEEAFRRFVGEIGRWWPLPYTFSEDRFETAGIEERAGGRWFERDLDGAETPWGEVRAFEPSRRLVLSFGISLERQPEPPEKSSEVEIRFAPASDGARIEVVHRDFAKHGDGAERLRDAMASRQGWPIILAAFARELRPAPGGDAPATA